MSERVEVAGTTRGAASAARILEVAQALFSQRGFTGVSVIEIAKAAGVSKANVFHHFRNKGELYKAVLTVANDQFDERLDELERDRSASLESFEDFMLADIESRLGGSQATLLVRALLDYENEENFRIVEKLLSRQLQRLVDRIPYFHEDAGIRDEVDARAVAIVLTASKFMYLLLRPYMSAHDRSVLTPQRFSQQVGEILCRGALKPMEASLDGR